MLNHLLFHAHTKEQVAQCRYFLLKHLEIYNLKPPAATKIVVYTNEPVAFEGFTNFFSCFEMREPAPLPGNAAKTMLLHQFFLQNSGAVLYCDTATYPVQPLEALFADIGKGNLYLHAPRRHPESELNKAFRKMPGLRDKTATAVAAPAPARVNVWHTAVIGISDRNKDRIERLLQEAPGAENALATDYSYTKVFGEEGKIKSAAKHISEYSGFKEFSQLLEAFFRKAEEESIPNQVKALHHINAAAIRQQRDQYHQQRFFKKWLQTITGKRWRIEQYIKKF